jgi:hypothetical protein
MAAAQCVSRIRKLPRGDAAIAFVILQVDHVAARLCFSRLEEKFHDP